MANWIIVIDDDAATLKLAGHLLSKAGYRVTALKSGRLALDYIRKSGVPDLFLLDLNMPDLDGFQTLELLRKEMAPGQDVPVIFLTAENRVEQEARGLESGAMDYIRKPFDPDVLINRVRRILDVQTQMNRLAVSAEKDPLTGMLNKAASEALMTRLCSREKGLLCVLDLDAFKSVNDIFGHDTGDRILVMFSQVLSSGLEHPDECGRIGGDEFIVFLRDRKRSEDLENFARKINEEYIAGARAILGDRLNSAIGVSVGAVSVPDNGRDYPELFRLADQTLYTVKRSGKHSSSLYRSAEGHDTGRYRELNLETITAILEERIEAPSAMWMGREVFGSLYKFMVRYMDRYHSCAFRVLLTLKISPEVAEAKRTKAIFLFRKTIRTSLRTSDIMMECGENQLFLLLPEIREHDIDRVISRLLHKWRESEYTEIAEVATEYAPVHPFRQADADGARTGSEWIVVVDDDPVIRKLTERLLTGERYTVTALSSGQDLVRLLRDKTPDLILLDLTMPDQDGVETFRRVKKEIPESAVPVIFLTADISPEAETKCLQLGAMDFIRKPFTPEILLLRVQHILELSHLRKNLTDAVARKTGELERMSLHMVQALADTIDAKDRYTSGHSTRVADYAREIARRAGYTRAQQENVYMMALLHDIGKIAIPDAVINNPGELSSEEYEQVRVHSRVGARILRRIEEIPNLYEGARWHHEWYDGTGYPDALAGESIPEPARIIAVADAYDAMSHERRYRSGMPADEIRRELTDGRGTQFDPKFADIMLSMMDDGFVPESREEES